MKITTAGLELVSPKEEPLGLSKDNLRRVRKRKGAPKWVRKLSKMVESMAKNSAEEMPLGVIAQEIGGFIIELDKDGTTLSTDKAKNKRQCEKVKKKEAKAKAKKLAKKEQKCRKHEDRKKLTKAVSYSLDDSRSFCDSSDTTSCDLASDLLSNSNGFSDREKRNKLRDNGGRDGTLKPRRGRPEDFEFRRINGRKHFRTHTGTWQYCTNQLSDHVS